MTSQSATTRCERSGDIVTTIDERDLDTIRDITSRLGLADGYPHVRSSSIRLNQRITGFQLAMFWSTNLKLLI